MNRTQKQIVGSVVLILIGFIAILPAPYLSEYSVFALPLVFGSVFGLLAGLLLIVKTILD